MIIHKITNGNEITTWERMEAYSDPPEISAELYRAKRGVEPRECFRLGALVFIEVPHYAASLHKKAPA